MATSMQPYTHMYKTAALWGDQFWQITFAKIGPCGGLILTKGDQFWQPKLVQPNQFWQQKWFGGPVLAGFSAKIGLARPSFGRTDFGVTGQLGGRTWNCCTASWTSFLWPCSVIASSLVLIDTTTPSHIKTFC